MGSKILEWKDSAFANICEFKNLCSRCAIDWSWERDRFERGTERKREREKSKRMREKERERENEDFSWTIDSD